jgi:hypothetical protein
MSPQSDEDCAWAERPIAVSPFSFDAPFVLCVPSRRDTATHQTHKKLNLFSPSPRPSPPQSRGRGKRYSCDFATLQNVDPVSYSTFSSVQPFSPEYRGEGSEFSCIGRTTQVASTTLGKPWCGLSSRKRVRNTILQAVIKAETGSCLSPWHRDCPSEK